MLAWRVTIGRDEAFFSEYEDAYNYAKLICTEYTKLVDSVVILEKGWREKLPKDDNA
jgi:hypothetical protein